MGCLSAGDTRCFKKISLTVSLTVSTPVSLLVSLAVSEARCLCQPCFCFSRSEARRYIPGPGPGHQLPTLPTAANQTLFRIWWVGGPGRLEMARGPSYRARGPSYRMRPVLRPCAAFCRPAMQQTCHPGKRQVPGIEPQRIHDMNGSGSGRN